MGLFIATSGRVGVATAVVGGGDPPAAQTFAEWLASTNSNAGPAKRWLMDDASGSTMAADIGVLAGTYTNTSDLEFEVVDASAVKYIGFVGTNGHIEITTPLTTGDFTVMMTLQLDAAPSTMTLLSTAFTGVAGQFVFNLVDDSAGGSKFRLSSYSSTPALVQWVGTSAANVPTGTTARIFLIRDGGSIKAWVHDIDASTVSQIPLSLNAGTPPGSWDAPPAGTVYVGSAISGLQPFNGVMRDLCMWDAALSDSDIEALALVTDPGEPIVVWAKALDGGEVNESTALADIPVLTNIHPATGYTLSVVDGTGTFGTLTTDGTDLTYTAGAISGDQTDSAMSWKITAGGVDSPTVGFSIDVLETGAGGGEFTHDAINCFDDTNAIIVNVSSIAALVNAVNTASDLTVVRVATGTYAGGTQSFTKAATSTTQVIVRPAGALGDVTINNPRWTMTSASKWLVFEKLHFTGSQIKMSGDHNRISRCRFRNINVNGSIYVSDNAVGPTSNCRIDHCDFSDQVATASLTASIYIRPDSWTTDQSHHLLIDHCYWHGMHVSAPPQVNSTALINSFGSANTLDLGPAGQTITFYRNLIDDVTVANTGEIIVVKMGGWLIRENTFNDIGSEYLSMRTCGNAEIRSNWFESMGPVQIWGDNHLVIGNRFIGGIECWVTCGNASYAAMLAGSASIASYPPTTNATLIGNRLGSGTIDCGRFWAGGTDDTLPASNILLEANTRDSGGSAHSINNTFQNPGVTGLTVNATTAEAFTPAVKLTSADVGLLAADPMCP